MEGFVMTERIFIIANREDAQLIGNKESRILELFVLKMIDGGEEMIDG